MKNHPQSESVRSYGAARTTKWKYAVSAAALAAGAMLSTSANAIVFRHDVGFNGAAAFGAQDVFSPVAQIFLLDDASGGIFFNCTGTLINPRQIITAAHCFNDSGATSSEIYGAFGSGASVTPLIAFGDNTLNGILNFANSGLSYSQGGVAQGIDVIIQPNGNPASGADFLPFPYGDVALVTLDEPIVDIQPMSLLLSPLDGPTHVLMAGYGSYGDGLTGSGPIGFQRLGGENTLALAGSLRDYVQGVFGGDFFPDDTQLLYHVDNDQPGPDADCRSGGFFLGDGTFVESPGSVGCAPGDSSLGFNPFNQDDALPNEVGTAGGDSGGPLIADELTDIPLIIGTLSGGLPIFSGNNQYGDTSYYNPLFLFNQFIAEFTATKYVSAHAGDGQWTDPDHWVQLLDPGFFIINDNGEIVNGLPEGPDLGVHGTGPKFGEILGTDISGFDATPSPILPASASSAGSSTAVSVGGVTLTSQPALGAVMAGGAPLIASGASAPAADLRSQLSIADGEMSDASVASASTAASTAGAFGPGSTGFVPDNTNGQIGVAYQNDAQFFQVILSEAGTTTLSGASVEVDALDITGADAGLHVAGDGLINILIGSSQMGGTLGVDGVFLTTNHRQLGGEMTVGENGVFFVNGNYVNAGGHAVIDGLADLGSFSQTGGLTEIGETGTLFDFFGLSAQDGGAVLNNGLIDTAIYALSSGAFGGDGTVFADSFSGFFDNVGGIVSPGETIGALTINGTYFQEPDGVLLIEASEGGADLLQVRDGAFLGGVVRFAASGSAPLAGSSFTYLTAGGGLSGDFAAVDNRLPGLLGVDLRTEGNSLLADIILTAKYADQGLTTKGARHVAGVIDGLNRASLPEGFREFLSQFDTHPEDINAALNAIAPSGISLSHQQMQQFGITLGNQFAARSSAVFGGGTSLASTASLRPMLASATPDAASMLAAADAALASSENGGSPASRTTWAGGRGGMFVAADTAFGDAASAFGPDGDLDSWAVTFGADYRVSDGFLLGGAFSYMDGTADMSTTGELKTKGWTLSSYAALNMGGLFSDAYIGWGRASEDTIRTVPGANGTARYMGNTQGGQFYASIRGGYLFDTGFGLHVGPVGEFMYGKVKLDAYDEVGPAGALSFGDREFETDRVGAGLFASHDISMFGGKLTPYVEGKHIWELADDTQNATANFTSVANSTFVINGLPLDDDYWTVGAGVQTKLMSNVGLRIGYETDLGRSDLDVSRVSAALRMNF